MSTSGSNAEENPSVRVSQQSTETVDSEAVLQELSVRVADRLKQMSEAPKADGVGTSQAGEQRSSREYYCQCPRCLLLSAL